MLTTLARWISICLNYYSSVRITATLVDISLWYWFTWFIFVLVTLVTTGVIVQAVMTISGNRSAVVSGASQTLQMSQ